MLKRITNINDNDIQIQYDTEEEFNMTYDKRSIYNSKIETPMQKYWFFLENCRVTKINSNITIVLPYCDKFINYTKELEKKISLFLKYKKHIHNAIKINTVNKIPSMIIAMPKETPIFNYKAEQIKNIKINDNIMCYIELDKIIYDDVDELWFKWKFLQIKIIQDIDLSVCFFNTPTVPTIIASSTTATTSIASTTSTTSNNKQNTITSKTPISNTSNISNTSQPPRLVLSMETLKEQLKKLNKVS